MAKTNAKKKQQRPFLFYGHTPGDWTEGPQLWLIRFFEPLSEEKRGTLGQVAAELLHGKPLAIESLHFAIEGPWAALTSEQSDQEPFPMAAKLLLAFHPIAPIAEVILATAREPGDSTWDRWSEKQGLPCVFRGVVEPTGDELVRIDLYFRTRGTDDDYPARCEAEALVAVEPSPAFEQAYREGAEKLFRAELDEALAKATKSGKPALLPVASGAVQLPRLTDAEAQKMGKVYGFARSAEGRVVAGVNRGIRSELVVLDPGAEEPRLFDFRHGLPGKYHHLSPDGAHLLVVSRRDLIEIDLDTGAEHLVFQLPGQGPTAFSAGYLDSSDRVLAQVEAEHATLLVRKGSSRQLEAVSDAEVIGFNVVTMRGRFAMVSNERTLRVIGVDGDRVAVLGMLKTGPRTTVFEAEHEGETKIFVHSEGNTYEIVNLDRAYEKTFKKKKKASKKASPKRKTASKKPQSIKLKLVSPSAAPDPDHEARWQGCVEWARWIGETASKRLVLRTRKGIAVIEDEKLLREIDLSEEGHFWMLAAQVHPTAERALLVHGDESQLAELDLDSGALRVLISSEAIESDFGGRLGGAMVPAAGWVVVLQRDKLTLHRDSAGGLSPATASMETAHSDLAPIRGGRACVLSSSANEGQLVEVDYDEAGAPAGFRHVATFKMPSKKYKDHGADPVMEQDDGLYLFTDYGCFRAPIE